MSFAFSLVRVSSDFLPGRLGLLIIGISFWRSGLALNKICSPYNAAEVFRNIFPMKTFRAKGNELNKLIIFFRAKIVKVMSIKKTYNK